MVSKFACDLGIILKSSTEVLASLVLKVESALNVVIVHALLKVKESSFECAELSLIHGLTPTKNHGKRTSWSRVMPPNVAFLFNFRGYFQIACGFAVYHEARTPSRKSGVINLDSFQ